MMNLEEKNLSNAESVIMKAIWDHGTYEDISIPDLILLLKEQYGRDYARTTVVTFLLKLSDKRFVSTYRKGKLSYVHAYKTLDDYREKVLNDMLEFWYDGDIALLQEKVDKRKAKGGKKGK